MEHFLNLSLSTQIHSSGSASGKPKLSQLSTWLLSPQQVLKLQTYFPLILVFILNSNYTLNDLYHSPDSICLIPSSCCCIYCPSYVEFSGPELSHSEQTLLGSPSLSFGQLFSTGPVYTSLLGHGSEATLSRF